MIFSGVPRDKTPVRHVTLTPHAFADDWPSKPGAEIAVGLRFVAQCDVDSARREADRVAAGFYHELAGAPGRFDVEEVFQTRDEELMIRVVAVAACDPNDVTKPFFELGDVMVRQALTPEGVRRLWDEYVLLSVGAGNGRYAADDDAVARVGRILAHAGRGLAPDDETRKMCGHLLERFAGFVEVPEDGDDDEDAEPVYRTAAAG